jgi:hypothetical protein
VTSQVTSSGASAVESTHSVTDSSVGVSPVERRYMEVHKSAQSEPWLSRRHDGRMPDMAMKQVAKDRGCEGESQGMGTSYVQTTILSCS